MPSLCSQLFETDSLTAAGWVACVFVWIFSMGKLNRSAHDPGTLNAPGTAFGYSWGPCAWVVTGETFPLKARAKGLSITTSSNWLLNFIIGYVTPYMVDP